MVGQGTSTHLIFLLFAFHSSKFRALCPEVTDIYPVDGGHRAIKYTRIGGVGKEIYQEGNFGP